MVVNLRCSRSAHRPADASKKRARGGADGAGRPGSFHLVRLTLFAVRDTWVLSIGRFPDSPSSALPVRCALPPGMQGAGPVDPTARPEPLRPSASTLGPAGHGHPPQQLVSGTRAAFHGARGRSQRSEMRAQSRSTSRGVWGAVTEPVAPHWPRRCSPKRPTQQTYCSSSTFMPSGGRGRRGPHLGPRHRQRVDRHLTLLGAAAQCHVVITSNDAGRSNRRRPGISDNPFFQRQSHFSRRLIESLSKPSM